MRAPLFFAIWVIMLVAMMFPIAAPMILTFHKVQAGKRQSGDAFVSTWVFVAAAPTPEEEDRRRLCPLLIIITGVSRNESVSASRRTDLRRPQATFHGKDF
jgi:hypothetical protein